MRIKLGIIGTIFIFGGIFISIISFEQAGAQDSKSFEEIEEKTSDTTDNFIGTEVICSQTDEPPYYDCSKKWNIHLYDTEYPQICNENIAIGLAAQACTKITHFGSEVRSVDIHLGNQHGSETTDPYPDGPKYQTKLYHELQHAICDCTWHSEIADEFL